MSPSAIILTVFIFEQVVLPPNFALSPTNYAADPEEEKPRDRVRHRGWSSAWMEEFCAESRKLPKPFPPGSTAGSGLSRPHTPPVLLGPAEPAAHPPSSYTPGRCRGENARVWAPGSQESHHLHLKQHVLSCSLSVTCCDPIPSPFFTSLSTSRPQPCTWTLSPPSPFIRKPLSISVLVPPPVMVSFGAG